MHKAHNDEEINNMIQQTACVILAGGKSIRMQTNKAFLKINATNFIDYLYLLLVNIGFKNIYISGNLDNYKCIQDSDNILGPVGAIFSCLKHLEKNQCSKLFFFSVDAPLISADIILQLLKYLGEHSCVYFENLMLPFLVNKENLSNIYYNKDKYKLHAIKDLLASLNASHKPVCEHESYIIKGVNTQEEYFKYMEKIGELK